MALNQSERFRLHRGLKKEITLSEKNCFFYSIGHSGWLYFVIDIEFKKLDFYFRLSVCPLNMHLSETTRYIVLKFSYGDK